MACIQRSLSLYMYALMYNQIVNRQTGRWPENNKQPRFAESAKPGLSGEAGRGEPSRMNQAWAGAASTAAGAASAAGAVSLASSSMKHMSAPSPMRWPSLMMRV